MRIVLERGRGPLNRLVMWWTDGPYSHAAMLFDDGMVIEARPHYGVRCVRFEEAFPAGSDYDIFEVELTEEQEAEARKFAEAQVGKPYDWLGDWHFVTRKHYEEEPDAAWFCSELVFETLYWVGVALLARTRGFEVPPSWLQRSQLALA